MTVTFTGTTLPLIICSVSDVKPTTQADGTPLRPGQTLIDSLGVKYMFDGTNWFLS